mmetsp:Transcript_58051/g.163926  ORF Transcript_58051/g.163926 Transcript_58051/m.163926 type:complete len:323 (-) Transcript_58051:102-1070(-)
MTLGPSVVSADWVLSGVKASVSTAPAPDAPPCFSLLAATSLEEGRLLNGDSCLGLNGLDLAPSCDSKFSLTWAVIAALLVDTRGVVDEVPGGCVSTCSLNVATFLGFFLAVDGERTIVIPSPPGSDGDPLPSGGVSSGSSTSFFSIFWPVNHVRPRSRSRDGETLCRSPSVGGFSLFSLRGGVSPGDGDSATSDDLPTLAVCARCREGWTGKAPVDFCTASPTNSPPLTLFFEGLGVLRGSCWVCARTSAFAAGFMSLTFTILSVGRMNRPCCGSHSKYRAPATLPSFFPAGASSSTPTHSPCAKLVEPRNLIVPTWLLLPI